LGETLLRYTEKDIIAAQRAWWMGSASYQYVLKIALAISIVYIVLMVAIPEVTGSDSSATVSFLAIEIAVAIAMAFAATFLIFAISYVLTPWRARRGFRENKLLQDEMRWHWDSEALQMTSPQANARIPWGMFHAWLDGAETVLLYQNQQLFHPLPKRLLAPGDIETIIQNLVVAGVKERKRFGLFGRARKA
jgi:hypothetical protein